MSVAKDLYLEMYEEAMGEFLNAGMSEKEADELASRYAERELPNRLADISDHAYQQQKEARRG